MGLDMYAWSVKDHSDLQNVDQKFSDPETGERVEKYDLQELFYWRKHPNLHGWMERLYRTKEGQDESFNCNTVRLTAEDLDKLEQDLRAESLPETSGFFFGQSTDEGTQRDCEFIKLARDAIAEGRAIYYDSWW